MSRKRGRIVLVGVTGLELSRDDFFKKELTFQVSCSYGPGRYDTSYEDKGQDYPIAYVRWTEQRNFEAVLGTLADGRLRVEPLISHRFALEDAEAAYAIVSGGEPSLGILLEYPSAAAESEKTLRTRRVAITTGQLANASTASPSVAFIGAGNYATASLIPAFKSAGARLVTVASSTGVSAVHAGRKHGFRDASTDSTAILADPEIDAVVISTRHDSHADLVVQALEASKHVFVEKPLCLGLDELAAIDAAHGAAKGALLMVGFNRRFAPQIQEMKRLLSGLSGPKSFVVTLNAGAVAADHWTQDPAVGGGRIIGEACHFVDLLRFLSGSPIVSHQRTALKSPTGDTLTMQLGFADGSIGTIHYFANGSKAFPKERIEAFAVGRILQLDNFKKLKGFGWPGFTRMNLWRQDKGQKACARAFLDAVRAGSGSPIPFDELVEVARTTIALGV